MTINVRHLSMLNGMIPQKQFESFGDDIDFSTFEKFANDCFFDFNDASCDSAFSSVELSGKIPTTTTKDVSQVDMEQPDGFQGGFFDSAFASDDTLDNLQSDMSVWPTGIFTKQPGGIQGGDWPSLPNLQAPGILPAGPTTSASPAAQHSEVLPATPLGQSIGPIEALWRPVIGFSPPTKAPPRPTRPRAPPKLKASKTKAAAVLKPTPKSKVTKATKKKKNPAANKRTSSVQESCERSMQELYNAAWDTFSKGEKERLLLPLLQGIDPRTGEKTAEAGSILAPVDFAAIGADVLGNYHQTSSPAAGTTSRGDSSSPNNADYDAIAADYSPPTSNQTTMNDSDLEAMGTASINETSQDEDFSNHMLAALKAFNSCDGTTVPTSSSYVDFSQGLNNVSADANSNVDANTTIGRGLGGPVQMPAPPSIYGCIRQQEALERNAMLRAQGRRR
ncbi:hypothetical protein DDE83_002278 [Stemphylium lycopersici]|uniref:Uncharacterized protein n=1 Tax=Stemphylium lycopersici TaxID=183478 RepID=A0A364NAH3_STELY|nr:hypothetical protein DDE83_002278 [Stemphylium lycopersici]